MPYCLGVGPFAMFTFELGARRVDAARAPAGFWPLASGHILHPWTLLCLIAWVWGRLRFLLLSWGRGASTRRALVVHAYLAAADSAARTPNRCFLCLALLARQDVRRLTRSGFLIVVHAYLGAADSAAHTQKRSRHKTFTAWSLHSTNLSHVSRFKVTSR